MAQPGMAFRQGVAAAGEAIAVPGDRRTAEVHRLVAHVAHQLDHVRVEQGVRVLDGGGQGRHRRIAADQRVGHCADTGRRRERFIALQVHHHGVIGPAGNARALGQTVASPDSVSAMRWSSVATQTSPAPACSARRATCRTSGSPPSRRSGLPGSRDAA
ncbi:hypothetical protein G6F50_015152 [Rhizopus delemar]|uniref:Uncharacterized protein n=1 Tax=Rhizopus delemar TaxID=936053 RepID=A0A9P6XZX3_9FUNG|nr:hypothetical protein G6F50_015152 [Rhizopus delemar]